LKMQQVRYFLTLCQELNFTRAARLNLDEAKEAKQEPDQPVSAPVISTPDPANDRGERGLSSRRVQEHARWYSDAAYWSYSPNALAAGALDAELRAILRKEVSLEHVEIEFERVMKALSVNSTGEAG
jgi:hypothetical protein